jgi:apolipoprotein N-acyltransferase
MSAWTDQLRIGRDRLRAAAAPRARWLLVAGVVLTAVGAVLPWTVSGVGYTNPLAGDLDVVGVDGHRIYVLLLALMAAVGATRLDGRRRVALATALCALGITAYMLRGAIKEGGGTGAVGVGAWIALVGALALLIAADTLPASTPLHLPRLPAYVDILLLFVVTGVGLAALV